MVNEFEIRKQICDIGKRIYNRNMVAANDGNISVKISDNEFLCTPTGVSKGFMTPECICKVDAQGNVISANGKFKPSSEIKMHMRVYQERQDVRAVVQAHPVYATSFAIAGIPMTQPIMSEAVIALGCVPVVKYGRLSAMEIPDVVSEYIQHYDAVLLENYGVLTYADSLLSAYMKMESVEFYAQLLYQSKMLSGPQEKVGNPSWHSCGGNCTCGHESGKGECHGDGSCGCHSESNGASIDALVADITKRIMEQLNK